MYSSTISFDCILGTAGTGAPTVLVRQMIAVAVKVPHRLIIKLARANIYQQQLEGQRA